MEISLFILFICSVFYKVTDGYLYKTAFIKQKVDHFNYATSDTFFQRYLLNVDHYNTTGYGTVFVYAGNEGDIEMFANNTGFMWEHAPMFKAALLFIEHRYYGKSLPYGDLSLKNLTYLAYLSSEQALADYAAVIIYIKKTLPNADKVPFIIFGGSYGGMLSAWMRIKYPHLVNGAIASSAPVLLSAESPESCGEFPEIVTRDFLQDGGIECIKSIKMSWAIIEQLYKKTGGKENLIEKFHLCQSNSFDIDELISWLSDTWSFLAMTNYPYPTNFLRPLPGFPIKEVCKYLQNSSIPDDEILFNIYKAASVFHNYTGHAKCFNLSESAGKNLGSLAWGFQACTEIIQPLCQTGISDMFEPLDFNYTAYEENCLQIYGVKPDASKMFMMYGGHNLKSFSNIVFTNGLLDPWSYAGILHSVSKTVVAIVMKDAAHHIDLRSSNALDPVSVINARQQIIKYIWKFIMSSQKQIHIRK